jgi:nicotinamide mononucleotide transporter
MISFENVAAAVGILSVFLSAREKVWSWPLALVNVSMYFVIFYQAKLYADMGLQVVYFALSLYGWYEWLYGGENRTVLHVSRATRPLLLRLAAIGLVGAIGLGTLLARFTDASLPFLDSALTTTSLLAQWMMTRKILENWIVWIAVDIVYVPMFIYKDLHSTAVQYGVFLGLAMMGFVQWRRSLAATAAAR